VVARGRNSEAQEALGTLKETLASWRKRAVFDDEEPSGAGSGRGPECARDGGRSGRRYVTLLERFSLRWGSVQQTGR